ncbi:hypothetical protein SAMN05444972_107108 [Marininema halotolerans]|uniref:Uncharacterized protein n=1 Tax=Marininema halotolerans TaxID=1155944 RepID=A0A1I6SI36_9BACL|nr:hypothetical protein SAMN05444972_107108 [Marininema halotolerans]
MERIERIFLYFFSFILFIGWLTNPIMDELVKLKIGIFGFFGTGSLLLINYIYKKGDANATYLSRIIELIVGVLIFIITISTFMYLN